MGTSSDESGTDIIRLTERVRHSNGKDRIWIRTFIIRNYPYRISIRKFNVKFLWSKYDEYHDSTQNILSESDLRIQTETEKLSLSTVSVRIRSIFIPRYKIGTKCKMQARQA
jgi:hypothetical protein